MVLTSANKTIVDSLWSLCKTVAIILLLATPVKVAALCETWSRHPETAVFNPSFASEVSGIAVSRSYDDRLYFVNDGPGDPYFYVSDWNAGNIQAVRLRDFDASNSDVEDISVGPCNADRACLFIADIGDNHHTRQSAQILVVAELGHFGQSTRTDTVIRFSYPDGPHNAEAMAVHANGDIYVVTKEGSFSGNVSFPARVYTLKRMQWESGNAQDLHIMEFVTELDLPGLALPYSVGFAPVATAMDISSDGSRFLVLTYELAFEFAVDLANTTSAFGPELIRGEHYAPIHVKVLPQQEAIAYLSGDKGFLYTTELRYGEVELIRYSCER
ncbi:MAG: hypothetical protein OEU36_13135 [Gammaproteobacteria bacterium]|nr:hypothetical protein [Gammaproteobacteria bacterium]